MLIGSPSKRAEIAGFFVFDLLGASLALSNSAKNLGLIFDSSFTFSVYVSAICRASFYKIGILSRVRRHLSLKAATMFANALVSSKLDHCKSLLQGSLAEISEDSSSRRTLCIGLSVNFHVDLTFLNTFNPYIGSP